MLKNNNVSVDIEDFKGFNGGIYVSKLLQKIAYLSNRKFYTCYIDLTIVYDHMNRDIFFSSVRNLTEDLYRSTAVCMSGENSSNETF